MIGDILKSIFTGPTPYRIFSFILIVLIIVWFKWGVKIVQQKEAKQNQQIQSIQKTAETIQETAEKTKQLLLQQLKEANSINNPRLMEEYPLGYCLFAVDHKRIIIPYKSHFESDYEIDWTTAEITKLTSEKVVIRLPKIHDKVDHIEIKGIAVATSRQVGAVKKHFGGYGPQIFTEVVANDEKGVIIALGFKQR